MNLLTASKQWSTRPSDERFWTLEDAKEAMQQLREKSVGATVSPRDIVFTDNGGEVIVSGKESKARFTYHGFQQMAQLMGAPADYLRKLPAEVTATCLNSGLVNRVCSDEKDKPLQLLLTRNNGDLMLRATTSEHYERIWNYDILRRAVSLPERGWQTTPARPPFHVDLCEPRLATEQDCGAFTLIKPGDTIAPSGIYASDKDLFIFMIHPEREVGQGLFRGFIMENSELGDRSFKIMTFLFNYVCGNHIIWDARNINELRIIHRTGANEKAWNRLSAELIHYADDSTSDDEARVEHYKNLQIAGNMEDVITKLFEKRVAGKSTLQIAYNAINSFPQDYGNGNPKSVWAWMQGLSRVSQNNQYADARVEADKAEIGRAHV